MTNVDDGRLLPRPQASGCRGRGLHRIYVKGCCDARGIATEGLGLEMQVERDPERRMTAASPVSVG
jgi:hypothetical protein